MTLYTVRKSVDADLADMPGKLYLAFEDGSVLNVTADQIVPVVEKKEESEEVFHINLSYNEGRNSCDCYGILEENSNFEVVCYDEEFDTVWTVGNPETDKPFETWSEVLDVLRRNYCDRIEQITAV